MQVAPLFTVDAALRIMRVLLSKGTDCFQSDAEPSSSHSASSQAWSDPWLSVAEGRTSQILSVALRPGPSAGLASRFPFRTCWLIPSTKNYGFHLGTTIVSPVSLSNVTPRFAGA
jgi:hypothetical protein